MFDPLWPGVGAPKQFPWMNWLGARFLPGSHRITGWTEMSGEPLIRSLLKPWSETVRVPSGSSVPAAEETAALELVLPASCGLTPLWSVVRPPKYLHIIYARC